MVTYYFLVQLLTLFYIVLYVVIIANVHVFVNNFVNVIKYLTNVYVIFWPNRNWTLLQTSTALNFSCIRNISDLKQLHRFGYIASKYDMLQLGCKWYLIDDPLSVLTYLKDNFDNQIDFSCVKTSDGNLLHFLVGNSHMRNKDIKYWTQLLDFCVNKFGYNPNYDVKTLNGWWGQTPLDNANRFYRNKNMVPVIHLLKSKYNAKTRKDQFWEVDIRFFLVS